MSYKDISPHLQEMYGLEISSGTLAAVTDEILQTVKAWKARPLESIYPIVWLDAIHYKIRENGRLQVLTDLSNRGVSDILIACIESLKGFPETEVQLCIVHQIQNSLKYIGSKDQKAFMADLKRVYKATSKDVALIELDHLEERWSKKYPIVIRSWRNNWERLSQYSKSLKAIRRIIYTTNPIEVVHRQCRKLTKTKGTFPNENSLLKRLYFGIQNASKKWAMPI